MKTFKFLKKYKSLFAFMVLGLTITLSSCGDSLFVDNGEGSVIVTKDASMRTYNKFGLKYRYTLTGYRDDLNVMTHYIVYSNKDFDVGDTLRFGK